MNCQTSNILYQVALVVKNLSANAGDAGGPGLIPGLGVGNGNPLWYSCLENSIDRGAWWATVHGVAKNQTWLSDWEHKQTHTTVQGLAQDEDTETDRIGQGFKSLINRTQWWILKKGWGKRHQKLTCSCLIWPPTKQLRWASTGRIQFLEGWIERKQNNQGKIGGKTALFEISFVQLSFRTKNSSFYWHSTS